MRGCILPHMSKQYGPGLAGAMMPAERVKRIRENMAGAEAWQIDLALNGTATVNTAETTILKARLT